MKREEMVKVVVMVVLIFIEMCPFISVRQCVFSVIATQRSTKCGQSQTALLECLRHPLTRLSPYRESCVKFEIRNAAQRKKAGKDGMDCRYDMPRIIQTAVMRI